MSMTATISSEQVKNLREQSGAAMMECKKALVEAKGDFDKATRILKERGLAKAEKKASRATGQGLVTSYIHQGRVGVLIEIACETDFVARCADMQTLSKDLAMQIASLAPKYISREQVPPDEVKKVQASFVASNGPVEKQTEQWYRQACLLDQAFIRDSSQRIKDVLVQAIAKIGENLVIKRFTRFEVGEI